MKRPSKRKKLLENITDDHEASQQEGSNTQWQPFSSDIKENEAFLKNLLGTSQDVIYSNFQIQLQHEEHLSAMLVAIDGLVDEEGKRNNIIKPLIEPPLEEKPDENLQFIQERLSVKQIVHEYNLVKASYQILKSQALLIVDGFAKGLLLSIEGFEIRAIEEPESEQVVKGAREGFIEALGVNLTMIRRRVSHPSLRFETLEFGEYSNTDITIAYIKDIADPTLLQRVRNRLQEIKVDTINSSGELEQLIEDHPYSIFPTIGNTERPDKTAALLMEGRVFILVDGNPVCLFVPFQFVESIKSMEDYGSRPYYTTFIRLLRFISFVVSITFPSLYISTINFNKSLIPSDMIVPLIVAREAVPFPLALEVLILIAMFEVVREAGVRLPKQVGTAVSIVGPLILGDVAVTSGLVGAPTVIVVSISYIAAFVISPLTDVTSLVRIGLFIASSLFGSFGLTVGLLTLITHMVSLTSLGVPYMAPFSPFYFRDWKDTLIRFPTRLMKRRAKSIPNKHNKKIESVPDTGDKE